MASYRSTKSGPPGDALRALRHSKGWSLRQAADAADAQGYPLTFSAISRIESNQGYTSSSLEAMARLYGVRVEDLFIPRQILSIATLPVETRDRLLLQIQELVTLYREASPTTKGPDERCCKH